MMIAGNPGLQRAVLPVHRQGDDAETSIVLGTPGPGVHPAPAAASVADPATVPHVADGVGQDAVPTDRHRPVAPAD
jgi:hypothetical protein